MHPKSGHRFSDKCMDQKKYIPKRNPIQYLGHIIEKPPPPKFRKLNMKFFIDTADVDEIREWNKTGLIDGVTTNPSLILKSGRKIEEALAEICALVDGPVSGEVTAIDTDGMISQGKILAKIAKNICIKLPLTTFRQFGLYVRKKAQVSTIVQTWSLKSYACRKRPASHPRDQKLPRSISIQFLPGRSVTSMSAL